MLLLVFGPRYFARASRGADENHGGTGCGAPNFCVPSVGALSIDDVPSRGTPCLADTASVPCWPAWCDEDPERLAVLKNITGNGSSSALLDNGQMSLSRVGVSTAREYTWLCQNADTETGICE